MARPFDFPEFTKQQAFFRQWNLCAHCGGSLVDAYDHAHHVVPNQLGREGNPADAWMREPDNCVILCDACHNRVHQDGRFQAGAVASPDDFPYSHGHKTLEHRAWAARMRDRFLW
jgi:hypothetical protein